MASKHVILSLVDQSNAPPARLKHVLFPSLSVPIVVKMSKIVEYMNKPENSRAVWVIFSAQT